MTRSSANPVTRFQIARASSSAPTPGSSGSSPPKTVTHIRDGVDAVDLGEQLPRPRDRVLLEVVAEREVAEHLEERVVARRLADLVEVVVLAAGAHALLRGRRALVRALLGAGEHVLELDHPGVGEQQRRVVGGHERARGHDLVALALEELEKSSADVGGVHTAGQPSRSARARRRRPGKSPGKSPGIPAASARAQRRTRPRITHRRFAHVSRGRRP